MFIFFQKCFDFLKNFQFSWTCWSFFSNFFFLTKVLSFFNSFNHEEENSTNYNEVDNSAQEFTICNTIPSKLSNVLYIRSFQGWFNRSGVMISLTNELMIAPKAVAMITPTARSTTLPRSKKSLSSFNIIFFLSKFFSLNYIVNLY